MMNGMIVQRRLNQVTTVFIFFTHNHSALFDKSHITWINLFVSSKIKLLFRYKSDFISFSFYFIFSFLNRYYRAFDLIGWQNNDKKKADDGWDDEPAPAKSNGKRKSDGWDDDDDWGSSSKRACPNGNRLFGERNAYSFCFLYLCVHACVLEYNSGIPFVLCEVLGFRTAIEHDWMISALYGNTFHFNSLRNLFEIFFPGWSGGASKSNGDGKWRTFSIWLPINFHNFINHRIIKFSHFSN